MPEISIVIRCCNDPRVFRCIDSIDEACDVVLALTPNTEIERGVQARGLPMSLSAPGNPAATTLAALPLCRYQTVMLVDSDCVLVPGAIRRLVEIARKADIVRPRVEFEAIGWSSYLTRLARDFQYTYRGHIYEPGLVLRLDRVLPVVGGYLFTEWAPFTPDGEFDDRAREVDLRVATDPETTLVHAALPFHRHLHSHWRYGLSEALRHHALGQAVLWPYLRHLPARYRCAQSDRYPKRTVPAILVSDLVYIVSMLSHLLALWVTRRKDGNLRTEHPAAHPGITGAGPFPC